jgi:hypothetical protein
MSAYDNDPRVTTHGGRIYEIELEGAPFGVVQPCEESFMFEAFTWADNPIKQEFRSTDEAIHSLIGDPQ